MGFNLVTMQARAATGLLERVFPAPNSEPEPNTSSTAAAPATARRNPHSWKNEDDQRFSIRQLQNVRPLLVAILNSTGASIPFKKDISNSAYNHSLAEEYRQHFDSEAEYKSLVSGFERLRTPVKTKTGADVIFINVQRYRLIHKTADTSSGSREGSAVAVRRGDPFYDLYLPRLCDILFSLNKTLRISHDEIEDEDTLVQEFDDVISSRALCALLYYPVSHRLEAKNYEESLAIADRWLDILSNCYP
ncbi:hypothetical protein [Sporisorium scitamineum]|uniref:Uncharacterized protein n=1 Tax=Sporisorium scitamineum TaxID=49012 RepID=A0A0F7SDE6_9BASI|nr:hypothetical protein [Sporisorium scitamineum]